MTFRKFASTTILEAQMGSDAGFAKSAHRAVFNYTPRAGYLYVRSRAISSRCNDNFDMFPADEIEKSYLTFIGKPVFVNHHNEDHRRSRGVIIDAALHRDRNPDGSPDTWAEVLMEVDAVKFPKLAKAILAGEVDRTSMGCDVQLSKCSVCHNVASSPLEYCAHIPGKKGKRIWRVDANGKKTSTLVFEICSGLSFFENSLLVEAPADPTAFFLGNVEVGPGLEHLTRTASKKTAERQVVHLARDYDDPQAVSTFCGRMLPHEHGFGDHRASGVKDVHAFQYGKTTCDHCADEFKWERPDAFGGGDSYSPKYSQILPSMSNPYGRETSYSYQEGAAYQAANFGKLNSDRPQFAVASRGPQSDVWALLQAAASQDHPAPSQRLSGASNPKEAMSVWDLLKTAAAIGDDLHDEDFQKTSDKAPDPAQFTTALHSDPAMQKAMLSHAEKTGTHWEQGVQHIMSHFLSAHELAHKGGASEETANLYHRGMDWYPRVHNTARMITGGHIKQGQKQVEGGDPHVGAGLLAAYSPKTNFGNNQRLAAEAYRLGRGIGGPSGVPTTKGPEPKARDPHNVPGFPAMRTHADKANRILGVQHDESNPGNWKKVEPEHWSKVIPNETSVKTHNFTSNIAHGGQNHEEVKAAARRGIDGRRVTVDDQALSIYLGRPATDKEHGDLAAGGALKGHPDAFRNNHIVASAYREANNRLSRLGHNVSPEQTQAVTWEHYRAAHPDEGEKTPESVARQKQKEKDAKTTATSYQKWRGYVGEHFKEHTDAEHAKVGVKREAYGETKAPVAVDTLRAENCNICGNSSAFDGTQCKVCGYVAPPRPFGDPNTDLASEQDFRKDVLDGNEADPNDPNQQLGNQVGDPQELQDQQDEAMAGEDTSLDGSLTCDRCGTGVVPAIPESQGDEPPYPADGDVCPVCQQGILGAGGGENPEDMESDTQGEGQEGLPDEKGSPNGSETGDEENAEESSDDQPDDESEDGEKKPDKQKKAAGWWKRNWSLL